MKEGIERSGLGQNLMPKNINIENTSAVTVKELTIKGSQMPEISSAQVGDANLSIRHGEVYIIETKNINRAEEFLRRIFHELDGNNEKYTLCLYTRHMGFKAEDFAQLKNLRVNAYQISTMSGKNIISPASLGFIKHTITDVARGEKPVVVIDCMDTLLLYSDYTTFNRFIEEILDITRAHQGISFFIIDPDTFEEKQLDKLRKFKSVIRV